jgi:signal peptidase
MATAAKVIRDSEGVGQRGDVLPAPLSLPETARPGTPPSRPAPRAPVAEDAPADVAHESEPLEANGAGSAARKAHPVLRVLGGLAKLLVGAACVTITALLVVPSVLPYDAFFVRTGSMRPELPVGSLIVSRRVPASQLHVGDVVSFVRPGVEGGLVTHRIVKIEQGPHGPQFQTQGDANPEPDSWFVDARGEGWKMVAHVRGAGYVVGTLRDALRHRTVVLVVTALMGLTTLVDIWRRPTTPTRTR